MDIIHLFVSDVIFDLILSDGCEFIKRPIVLERQFYDIDVYILWAKRRLDRLTRYHITKLEKQDSSLEGYFQQWSNMRTDPTFLSELLSNLGYIFPFLQRLRNNQYVLYKYIDMLETIYDSLKEDGDQLKPIFEPCDDDYDDDDGGEEEEENYDCGAEPVVCTEEFVEINDEEDQCAEQKVETRPQRAREQEAEMQLQRAREQEAEMQLQRAREQEAEKQLQRAREQEAEKQLKRTREQEKEQEEKEWQEQRQKRAEEEREDNERARARKQQLEEEERELELKRKQLEEEVRKLEQKKKEKKKEKKKKSEEEESAEEESAEEESEEDETEEEESEEEESDDDSEEDKDNEKEKERSSPSLEPPRRTAAKSPPKVNIIPVKLEEDIPPPPPTSLMPKGPLPALEAVKPKPVAATVTRPKPAPAKPKQVAAATVPVATSKPKPKPKQVAAAAVPVVPGPPSAPVIFDLPGPFSEFSRSHVPQEVALDLGVEMKALKTRSVGELLQEFKEGKIRTQDWTRKGLTQFLKWQRVPMKAGLSRGELEVLVKSTKR